jgi:hypothetical protein
MPSPTKILGVGFSLMADKSALSKIADLQYSLRAK